MITYEVIFEADVIEEAIGTGEDGEEDFVMDSLTNLIEEVGWCWAAIPYCRLTHLKKEAY